MAKDKKINTSIETNWFKDISIVNKLYFVVGVMALLIATELVILVFSINTLSSVRSYVGAEGLWSKAQKDANYSLQQYVRTGNEKYYQEFLNHLTIPLGDRIARIEMTKENPDKQILRDAFIKGDIHPDDINGMIRLFSRFHSIYYIRKAIEVWTEGDSLMSEYQLVAQNLHQSISSSGPLTNQQIDTHLSIIDDFNIKFTILENKFSSTLGEGSRWLERLILKILLSIALTVEISGLLLTLAISRNISKGIGEILRASEQVIKGNYNAKANVYSDDEIGQLASSFNKMTQELEHHISENEKRAAELSIMNKELMAFTYVSSHDLKEPLRKIQIFADRILDKEIDNLSESGQSSFQRIQSAASRMQQLIEDLLTFSRISTTELKFERTDLNSIVEEVKLELSDTINEKKAIIESDELAILDIIPFQFRQLMNNLISNSLKFSHPGLPPHIIITNRFEKGKNLGVSELSPEKKYFHLRLQDNGIGFEKQYSERIFEVFQRLHSKEEYPGTGIGLAIVKKIVLNHNGIIKATSEPNHGATFDIYIPA
jgi:signal transduction histidine kinase